MSIWRDVIGFEGFYEVSDAGEIRRIAPMCEWHRKLSPDDVKNVRMLSRAGVSQRAIGLKFGVSQTPIMRILRGRSYRQHVPNVLRRALRRDGYFFVTLSVNGTHKHMAIHTAVAAAFVGKRPKGFEINHIDGNKANNKADNLEYLSPTANVRHAVYTLGNKGRKLTKKDAAEIRALNCGLKRSVIADAYGISVHMVSAIWQGKSWLHC